MTNLPEKLGFLLEFQAEFQAVGGGIHSLATKLLNSFNLEDSGKFKTRQLWQLLSNFIFIQKHLMLVQ